MKSTTVKAGLERLFALQDLIIDIRCVALFLSRTSSGPHNQRDSKCKHGRFVNELALKS